MAAPAAGGLGSLIPGLPPDLAKLGDQAAAGLSQVLPGVIPPGLIPGQPAATAPVAQQQPLFKPGLVIINQPISVTDEQTREDILDLFGEEDSFQADHPQCFTPGMGISIGKNGAQPLQPGALDLIVSITCNQAQGDGFQWPYKVNGFTPDASKKMTEIFQKFFGPVQPGT